MKKFRGSYMVEMVLVAGAMALLATTALPQLTGAIQDRQENILTSLDAGQGNSHVKQDTAGQFSEQ
ncbi:type II secretion system protein [Vibrio harveyi]|uniref:type II secretion system protein n=1 Tax=Vibrio harveyi TaxID=669 RepID=UPI0018F12A10|nr:type II secretion system protein [Vibrio harveyi]